MKAYLILIASLAAQPAAAHPGAPHSTAAASARAGMIAVLAAYKSAINGSMPKIIRSQRDEINQMENLLQRS